MRIGTGSNGLCGKALALGAAGLLALTLGACGGDSGGGSHAGPKPPPLVTSPGSGLFAVNCSAGKAYVPLRFLDGNGMGQVAVINLLVDPDKTNPIIKIIELTHGDVPTGTALDNDDNLIIVVSGETFGQDGKVDLIDTKTDTLVSGSPFAFPTGSQAGYFGQVLYNPATHQALIATCDSSNCSSGQTLTGIATFDPATQTFGNIITTNYPESFAVNSKTNVVLDSSDDNLSGEMPALDISDSRACTLTDGNIGGTMNDQDGASFDTSTNLAVVSNADGTATVLNLHGSSFTPTSGTPCSLDEAGTQPNSVLVSGLPSGTAGSAINTATHQAFLVVDSTETGFNGNPAAISLMQLPTRPVGQLTTAPTFVTSTIPNDPNGNIWVSLGDPYAVAAASCKNLKNKGFTMDIASNFLVEVDLTKFKKNPNEISTALPSGNCAGTPTTFSCKNGKGVIFFPLGQSQGLAVNS